MLVRSLLSSNWGDNLNSELIRLITGNKPTIVNNSFKNPDKETIYMAIGSVLGWADEQTEIWGSGFISNSEFITTVPKPKKIHAVRGKLTRDILISKGIKCPKIYGDPALLMPHFYKPKMEKKYDLSIIPHAIDRCLIPILKKKFKKAHIIDITGDIYQFIDEVCASERIMSSALHGLICSDAYGIPNIWIKLSNKVLGNGMKFLDHFSAVNRKDIFPLIVNKESNILQIGQKFKQYTLADIDLNPLIKSCPFGKIK